MRGNFMTTQKEIVLWGFHPEFCKTTIKLERYTKAAQKRREKEGWITAGYKQGDEPTGLVQISLQMGAL